MLVIMLPILLIIIDMIVDYSLSHFIIQDYLF